MKYAVRCASCVGVALVGFVFVPGAEKSGKETPIEIAELNRRPVAGALGVPLGTAVEIQARVVAGRDLRSKAYDGLYLLKVTHVAGRKLDDFQTVKFTVAGFVSVQLARNAFELFHLKTGKRAESLNSKQVAQLENGYVGRNVRLVVYETGGFVGIPHKFPTDVPVPASSGFHFATELVVLAERRSAAKSAPLVSPQRVESRRLAK